MTFAAGERGFSAFDQSIVFDGGYRIASGQVPYKDFLIPVGPMAFVLQAIFFKLFGVSYHSYILCAAVINVISATLSIFIIRLLLPASRILSYAAGLLTAVWFYPPFGTPYLEQTGFFFILIALFLILSALRVVIHRPIAGNLLILTSGIAVFLSVISKQNVGIPIIPLFFILLIAANTSKPRKTFYRCIIFSAGFLLALISFWLWLLFFSDINNFYFYTIDIPSVYGIGRLIRERYGLTLIKELLINSTWIKSKTALAALLIDAVASLIIYFSLRNVKYMKDILKSCLLPGIVFIYLINYQHLFIRITNNSNYNGLAFIGLIFSLGAGLLFSLTDFISSRIKPAANNQPPFMKKALNIGGIMGASLAAVFLTSYGLDISLGRYVQHKFYRASYSDYFTVDKLKSLRWGQPTRIKNQEIKAEDIVNLLAYLNASGRNFLIFPDFSIFYGLTDHISPQPVLWFHKGLTYPETYNPKLDHWIVNDLRKNRVEIIVIEEASLYKTRGRLKDFPLLWAYIKNFNKVDQIGIFSIYEKTSQGS